MSKKITKADWQKHCKSQSIAFQDNDTIEMLVKSLAGQIGIKAGAKALDSLKEEVIEGLAYLKESKKAKKSGAKKPSSHMPEISNLVDKSILLITAEKKQLFQKHAQNVGMLLDRANASLMMARDYINNAKKFK